MASFVVCIDPHLFGTTCFSYCVLTLLHDLPPLVCISYPPSDLVQCFLRDNRFQQCLSPWQRASVTVLTGVFASSTRVSAFIGDITFAPGYLTPFYSSLTNH